MAYTRVEISDIINEGDFCNIVFGVDDDKKHRVRIDRKKLDKKTFRLLKKSKYLMVETYKDLFPLDKKITAIYMMTVKEPIYPSR